MIYSGSNAAGLSGYGLKALEGNAGAGGRRCRILSCKLASDLIWSCLLSIAGETHLKIPSFWRVLFGSMRVVHLYPSCPSPQNSHVFHVHHDHLHDHFSLSLRACESQQQDSSRKG